MSEASQHTQHRRVIREEWLFETAATLQRIACIAAVEGEESQALVAGISHVEHPSTRIEELVLGGLLLEFAAGGRAVTTHQLYDRARRLTTAFPRRAAWSNAQRAADQIARTSKHPLRVTALAHLVGCEESALRRQFRDEYGISLREYHVRTRMQKAVLLIANGTKISAVAPSVGYSSDKNLFRNIRALTGYTPADLRSLDGSTLDSIAASLVPGRLNHR